MRSPEEKAAAVQVPHMALQNELIWRIFTIKLLMKEGIQYYTLNFFFLIFFFNFYLLFIFGCVGSSFLCEGFLQLWRAEATLHRGARASHCRGLSRCGAQAPDAQAQ